VEVYIFFSLLPLLSAKSLDLFNYKILQKINENMTGKREVLGMGKLTYKFQITIPKKVRERFNLKEGETLVFVEENGKLIVVKSTEL